MEWNMLYIKTTYSIKGILWDTKRILSYAKL